MCNCKNEVILQSETVTRLLFYNQAFKGVCHCPMQDRSIGCWEEKRLLEKIENTMLKSPFDPLVDVTRNVFSEIGSRPFCSTV